MARESEDRLGVCCDVPGECPAISRYHHAHRRAGHHPTVTALGLSFPAHFGHLSCLEPHQLPWNHTFTAQHSALTKIFKRLKVLCKYFQVKKQNAIKEGKN